MDRLVSIILPTYNGGKYIKRAIESVISQTFTNWELLIIDDGSTDNTKDIAISFSIKDKRVIYLKNEDNLGIQKTLNRGIKEAKGKYIARIDDDDIWFDQDKLKKQFDFLENNPEYLLVGTGVIIIDENDNELVRYLLPEKDENIRNKILSKNCFVHSSVLFKKDKALSLGGYDESEEIRHIEDYDLWLRIGTIGKFTNLPYYLIKFTLRSNSISSKNKKDQFIKNVFLIKKYKNIYPNFYTSLIKAYLRYFIYLFYKMLSNNFKNKLIKFYKKNW